MKYEIDEGLGKPNNHSIDTTSIVKLDFKNFLSVQYKFLRVRVTYYTSYN